VQLTKSQKGDAVKLNCVNPDTHNQIKFNTDPLRLRQIFTNLLSHSLKYTDSGTISFGYNYHDVLAGKQLQFFVHDTGIGLSGDNKQLVFDRFYKVEDDNLKFYRGAGLGLTISKNLVSLLGGEIWAESEPGKGSKFYFQFPIEDVVITNDQKQATLKELDYTVLSGKTVLVAEDEDINFIYIDELLKKHGVNIIHARNGKEAVDLYVANKQIDLVLMDIKMPIMDGYEATRIIKEKKTNVPIIAQTAYALAGEKDKIIEAGCDDYLSKPIKPVSLFKLLTQYLDK
jgi:CheY-like chemotaxis protein